MGFWDLFTAASMPVLKVLLVTALGSVLALDRFDILGENARKHLNGIVFYVFNPAIVGSNLAGTVTVDSFMTLWFMPFNILITSLVGSALGWILVKVTGASQNIKGLIIGSCSAGNLGYLPLIIVPTVCREKGSPFGDADVCQTYGLAYASLSMAIGAILLWSYVYNIVRISSSQIGEKHVNDANGYGNSLGDLSHSNSEPLLASKDTSNAADEEQAFYRPRLQHLCARIAKSLSAFSEKINLKKLLAPSTTAAIAGFLIGMVPQLRSLLVGGEAPLRVIQSSASLLGDAAIPIVTLIIGGNLLKGLKGSSVQPSIIAGIVAIRFVILPLLGIVVVESAVRFGLVNADPLYRFVLLLQYAVPPAMNMGTITQLFRAGQNEGSVILLWTYALASVSLTVWSTFFLWLVVT